MPRPNEANLVTLYLEPTDDTAHWFDEFTSYITIPFGRPVTVESNGAIFQEFPIVELRLTGREIRRISFRNPAGDGWRWCVAGGFCASKSFTSAAKSILQVIEIENKK